jgi:UDP-N-acetylmuramate--alanine ligase
VPSLDAITSVHLIGIGGAGMRNLAKLFLARGISVAGSDLKDSKGLRELGAAGATVWVGHDATQLGASDAVVVSSAIGERNPELAAARERGLPVWARAQALAAFAEDRRAIAVAGTHGKTTTTSMAAVILETARTDPSYLVGGDLNESGSGARAGGGDLFLFEADESDGSFLLARPDVGIVTNIEVDHVDFYPGGQPEIEAAFEAFARRCAAVVACADDPAVRRVLAASDTPAVTYGIEEGDVRVRVGELGPRGARGHLVFEDGAELELELSVDGAHNLLNAAAAVLAARSVGADISVAPEALRAFTGVHRRFELRGRVRGAAPRRLIAVVQPHRYTRVQALWRELGSSVAEADLIVVTDVYGAAQPPIPGVTGKLVVDGVSLAAPGKRVVYLPHAGDVVAFLDREVREGDLVITMGCGDVWMLGDAALERIRSHAAEVAS